MLRFELDLVAADLNARTIEGVAVPYGEIGVIAGKRYRFRPGSIEFARTRTPLLVDHDRGRPVGVLAELVDGETNALVRFTIDPTQDGDTALVQAASGSRGSLSVGAELLESEPGPDGVIDVIRAAIHEVSLLALGAFASAGVTRVAAEADDEPELEEAEVVVPPEQEELELDPEPDPTPAPPASTPEEGTMTEAVEATAAPVIIQASAGWNRPDRELNAGELVSMYVRAAAGDPDARRYVEAALTESIHTDVAGLLPPQYERTVIGAKQTPRPLYNLYRSRPLPGVGLAVNKPKWTTPPVGAWAADVSADATSSKVVIGSQSANVERWDWAGAIPWVVVQRSDPSIIDEIYGQAVDNFYAAVEAKIAAKLAAAATDTAVSLGAAVAKFFTTNGRSPEVIVVAPDVWGKLADRGVLQTPVAGASVDVSTFGLAATWGGLPIVASASLAATFGYLTTRRAVDARVTEPVRLTANAIGALNVELAVVGEGLFDTDYPAELLEFVPTIPAPTGLEATSARSK